VTPELEGRASLVTGGGRGIGRVIAEALARAGAAVADVARSETEVGETADAIAERGGRAVAIPADVTDEAAVEQVVTQAERELGPIDLLVNNAGTCDAIGPLWEADPKRWRRDIESSLLGTFVCARSVLPGMIGRSRGRIINVSSYAAIRPAPNISAYAAAKAAVVHLTNSLAVETREHGIAVFAITPGTVRTAITKSMTESVAGRTWLPKIPTERWLSPQRAGDLVVFLASGKADRLSGRFIHVLDDAEDLARRADEIERNDLYVLRLRR
jgi:NAD(P)-dependent dehydrogenase (short-subunit alcohol dehydrogenase family)